MTGTWTASGPFEQVDWQAVFLPETPIPDLLVVVLIATAAENAMADGDEQHTPSARPFP